MAFGRRNKPIEVEFDEPTEEDIDNFVDDLTEEQRAAEDAELLRELADEDEPAAATTPEPVAPERPTGPWDITDAPTIETERLNLGSLKVPVLPEIDVRLEVSPEGDVVAVTLVHGESTLQLNAFAAPNRAGIWVDVRTEIQEALAAGGGQSHLEPGPLGTELRAGVPTEVPGEGVVLTAARFVGVDGPRWFLRGLITGAAAVDEALAAPLLEAFRQVVVDRGGEAMVVRESLPLQLPPDAVPTDVDGNPIETNPLALPERGPEITERR